MRKIKGLMGAWEYNAEQRKKAKTHEATMGGKKVRVTIPKNPDPTQVMIDAIEDNLSPAAVATIIAYLQPVRVKDKGVQREVEWFRDELVKAVGGGAGLKMLMDENGL